MGVEYLIIVKILMIMMLF